MILTFKSIPQAWNTLVPEFRSKRYNHCLFKIKSWDSSYSRHIAEWSPRITTSRWESYVPPIEIARVKTKLQTKREASIRFGLKKSGYGFHGERGDFCLLAGCIHTADLQLMYRRLNLIGGIAFDLTLIDRLGIELGIKWKSVTIYAVIAEVIALKGNSGERLFPKLKELFS